MRVYPALNDVQGKIHFPDYMTEGDVQSDVVAALKKDGFLVKTMLSFKANQPTAGCSFDIVVFKNNREPLAIIENKSPQEGPITDLDKTHQGLKYRGFGIPVILFWDMKEYAKLKDFLKEGKPPLEKAPTKVSFSLVALRRLHKSLDIAAMSAWDLGMNEFVAELENHRDRISLLTKEAA